MYVVSSGKCQELRLIRNYKNAIEISDFELRMKTKKKNNIRNKSVVDVLSIKFDLEMKYNSLNPVPAKFIPLRDVIFKQYFIKLKSMAVENKTTHEIHAE